MKPVKKSGDTGTDARVKPVKRSGDTDVRVKPVERSWGIGNVALLASDLHSTEDGEWLTDAVIDAYLLKLAHHAKAKVTIFDTHSLTTMRRWPVSRVLAAEIMKNAPADIWLVPFNTGQHWVMFAVNRSTKKIVFLDSLCPKPQSINMLYRSKRCQYRPDIRYLQDL